MAQVESSRSYDYDTLNRLITVRLSGTRNWSAASQQTIRHGGNKANRMTTLATVTQGYQKAGNLTVAYSADRGTSYRYYYDHQYRGTSVHRITGGSEPNWTSALVAVRRRAFHY